MKIALALPALLLVLSVAMFTSIAAQANSQPPAVQASVEPLGENETLPFMQTETSTVSSEPSAAGLLMKTLGSMALIIGLIFVGAWAAKKMGYGSAKAGSLIEGPELSVMNSVSLGNGRSVATIRFGTRLLLVGSTQQAFTLLAEQSDESFEDRAAPRSVAEMLADDNISFDEEIRKASSQLSIFSQTGGNA